MGFLFSSIGRVVGARVAFAARFDLNLTAIGEYNSADPHNLPCLFSSFGVKGGEIRDRFPSNTDFHLNGVTMKKPKIEADEPQPRKVIRADKAPTEGYSLVVDGHFKSHHDTVEAAEEAGMALKNKYQMLQVQVYDAVTKTRSMIEWPVPAA
jgi:hypothetical protein